MSTSTSCFPHSTIQTGDGSGQAPHAERVILTNRDFTFHPPPLHLHFIGPAPSLQPLLSTAFDQSLNVGPGSQAQEPRIQRHTDKQPPSQPSPPWTVRLLLRNPRAATKANSAKKRSILHRKIRRKTRRVSFHFPESQPKHLTVDHPAQPSAVDRPGPNALRRFKRSCTDSQRMPSSPPYISYHLLPTVLGACSETSGLSTHTLRAKSQAIQKRFPACATKPHPPTVWTEALGEG